jgi:tryptophan synthase alpha chain
VTALRRLFEKTRSEKRAALIPYLTAGDPDLEQTVELACALVEGGSDLLELGVPFSDPLADGPVIQRACARALAGGTRFGDVLEAASRVHERTGAGIVLMSYVNPVLRYGWERFAGESGQAGVVGVILTDVPPEEAGPFLPPASRAGLGTVFLVAPTSGRRRVLSALAVTTGFLYCVSRLGVTGARERLSESFRPTLQLVREVSDVPVGIGFGISTAEQAWEAGAYADGVIIGSALVAAAEEAGSRRAAARALESAARSFRRALEGARGS